MFLFLFIFFNLILKTNSVVISNAGKRKPDQNRWIYSKQKAYQKQISINTKNIRNYKQNITKKLGVKFLVKIFLKKLISMRLLIWYF